MLRINTTNPIEITQNYIIVQCNNLHIYQRSNLNLVATIKFPQSQGTVTIEYNKQLLIFGSYNANIYMAELLKIKQQKRKYF